MLNIEAWEGFAENLGVVSVEDSENGINQETLSQLDAKEIFLTGTTDKTVITAKNIYTQMPPASITKILTALVALETVQDLDQEVTLTDDVNVDVADAQAVSYTHLPLYEGFEKKAIYYMLESDYISGTDICLLLYSQHVLEEDDDYQGLLSGSLSAKNFMYNKIRCV